MKSIVCIFLFLNLNYSSFGQNFTNGTVYNYAVGDTIVTEYLEYWNGYSTSIPLKYRFYMAITGKTICPTNDTIFYTSFNSRVDFISFQPLNTITSSSIVTFTITDLLSSVISYSLQGADCQLQYDTTYLICGMAQHIKELLLNPDSICFEAPTVRHSAIEGIGTFMLSRSNNSFPNPGIGFETRLVSFHKGANICGTIGAMPTGVETQTQQAWQFEVYPNPVVGNLVQLKTPEAVIVEIFSLEGRKLLEQDFSVGDTHIDLSGLENGTYLLRYHNEKNTGNKKIIIHREN